MARLKTGLLILFCTCLVLKAQDKPKAKNRPERWEETIRAFEDWDRKNSFPSDAVLFVGSSSIRLWPTRECFEQFPVINRGFGGSQISDVNYYAKRIVLRYEPKVIAFYAGDNDVAAGKGAQQVFNDYKTFTKLVHAKLPRTRIIFVCIKPSRRRWSLWPVMSEANRMIEAFSEKDGRLFYFDAATPLLGDDGVPNLDFFLRDRLHLNSEGYEVWTGLLRPIIKEALKPDEN
ncbi:MAG: GDSL-type esterase/lipase family protein [Planctomycetota bacterium]|jgi:lysophospholipase L1-like esterase